MKLIFVSLDTVRADRLSCLGYPRPTTPNIDRIASEGALFTNVFASDIPTQPSHTALFTGRFGISTSIVSHFWPNSHLDITEPWLPSMLQAAGSPTGAVDHLFAMKDWFIRGYDDYKSPAGRSRAPAAAVNDLAFPFIQQHVDEDFFLFIHYWDAHIPYVPPPAFVERFAADAAAPRDPLVEYRLRSRPSYPLFRRNLYDFLDDIPNLDYVAALYDAEIAYLDHHIGELRALLERLGILDDTMLVFFGDHGENMTEHDAWFDHAGIYDSVVHVPLIMRHPASIEPSRVDAMVQLVDVLPTVCETLDLPIPLGTDGRSLHPLISGARGGERLAYLSEATWQAKRGIRSDTWKYIKSYHPGIYERSGPELYDVVNDPDEQFNLAQFFPEVVGDLDDELQGWISRKLRGRPDPLLEVVNTELPAVARLNSVICEERELQGKALKRASRIQSGRLGAATGHGG
jgi:arylsulfatase